MAKKKSAEEHENLERWLLTYADMITLLMLFFIVLYSMSNVDTAKYKEMAKALETVFAGGSLGVFQGQGAAGRGIIPYADQYPFGGLKPFVKRDKWHRKKSTEEMIPSHKIMEKAKVSLEAEIKSKRVLIREDERGLVITLTGDAYFDSGSAVLNEDIKPTLNKIADIITRVPNFVRIEGHTDASKVQQQPFRQNYNSNWELSSARSVNILRYLSEEQGVDPKQLSAVAFAEFRPIDDNSTPEGRAYNRRVEVVILKEKIVEESSSEEIKRPLPDEEWR